jgi:magnesium transporter
MPTTILTEGRVTWTHIYQPQAEDMRQLSARYPHFHPLNLKDCGADLEFPKLDHHDEYLFLVVQLPRWNADERISQPVEIDIFIAKGALVTVLHEELKPFTDLFNRAQNDAEARAALMGRGASPLLYDLLNALIDYCFPILTRVDQNIRHIETMLFRDDTHHLLGEIAVVRRDVIALRRILHPQLDIICKLEAGNWSFIHEDLDLYWSDLGDHLTQLRAMLDEQIEVVCGLADTVDTLASHRIDRVVQVLTVITMLTLPLSLLSTVFSMNVRLPLYDQPVVFFCTVIAVAVSITLALLLWLRRRRWL